MVGKPKNEVAMTSTERSRLSRERYRKQGKRDVNLVFSEDELSTLDEIVELFDLPNRSLAVSELLKTPFAHAVIAMQGLKDVPEYKELMKLDGEQAELWLKIRKATWVALCSQDKKARDDLLSTLQSFVDE